MKGRYLLSFILLIGIVLCTSTVFCVQVEAKNKLIKANKSSLSTTEGYYYGTCFVKVRLDDLKYKKDLQCTIQDKKIATAYIEKWNGAYATIEIGGVKAGSTKFIVRVKGTNEKIVIPIKVKRAKWLEWDLLTFNYKVKIKYMDDGQELSRAGKKVFVKKIASHKVGKIYEDNGVKYKYDQDGNVWYNTNDLMKKGLLDK